jgi:uncharacterized membrane protein YdjX (TVP38/TMEM64 family)
MSPKRALFWGGITAVLAMPFLGGIAFRVYGDELNWRINSMLAGLHSLGPSAWLLLALLQTFVAICGILPASVLGIAAGAVYGVPIGFLFTGVGTMLGAAISFRLARSTLRPRIERRFGHKPFLARLDRSIEKNGMRTVCLIRMSPVMPFALGSYALGLTSIKFSRYWLGSCAALPALLGYVILGSLAKHGVGVLSGGDAGPFQIAMVAIGIGATLWFIFHIGNVVRDVFSLKGDDDLTERFDEER